MTDTEREILGCEARIRLADASPQPDTSSILNDLLSENAVLVGPQGQIFTKSFILDAHRPPKKVLFDDVRVTEMVVRDLGTAAAVSCRAEFQRAGQTFSLRCTRVWHRENGNWRIVLGTVTGIA
jgi:Domain of unknown function (DUF4440)